MWLEALVCVLQMETRPWARGKNMHLFSKIIEERGELFFPSEATILDNIPLASNVEFARYWSLRRFKTTFIVKIGSSENIFTIDPLFLCLFSLLGFMILGRMSWCSGAWFKAQVAVYGRSYDSPLAQQLFYVWISLGSL